MLKETFKRNKGITLIALVVSWVKSEDDKFH